MASRQFGTLDTALAGLGLDLYGNVLVVGTTSEAVAGTVAKGGSDVVAWSLSPSNFSGTPVWTSRYGSTGDDIVTGFSMHGTTTYLCAGTTNSLLPSARGLNGASLSAGFGGIDGFLLSGTVVGAQPGAIQSVLQLGGPGTESSVVVGSDGLSVFIAGSTTSGLASARLGGGGVDAFMARVSPSLTAVWSPAFVQWGTSGTETVRSIHVPSTVNGDVFVSGATSGSISLSNPGGLDGFVTKYTANGDSRWDWQTNVAGDDEVWSVSSNNQSDDGDAPLFISGSTTSANWPTGSSAGDKDWFTSSIEGY
jgi:hypothetical protein